MTRKFYTSVDLNGLQLANLRVQNLSADPSTPYGKGHTYFNTVSNELRWYNGTVWTGIAELSDLTTAISAQSALDRAYTDSKVATVVATAISDLINGAPATLDTLSELAAALNNDASLSVTLTNAIATKVPLAGGTMTGLLTLSGAPTSNLHAATKAYADLKLSLTGGTMSGAIAMGANKITGLGTPTAGTDAATKGYADLMLPLAGGTMTGTLAMGANKITSTYYAVAMDDIVNKQHLNDTVNGGVGYGIGVAQAYTDTKVATAIANEVLDRNVNIANAKNEAVGISQTYSDTIMATEVTNRNAAIATNLTTAKNYTDAREAAEITARNAAISTHNLDTTDVHGIADTAALATKAYSDSSIATEVTNRNSAISSAISTEVTNRNTAISTSVSNAISTEVTDRNSAISSAISTEVTNRNTAITAQSVIDKAYTDSSIATEVTNRNTAIGVEATNRTSAIASAIATEVTDRNTAIAAEASLRITGDSTTLTSANTYTDSKFTALTSSAVPEGTNLYYTQERVQDEINNTLVIGTNLTGSYSDTPGTYTIGLGTKVVITDGTQTLTNKTLTNPYINDTVVVTATSTEINKLAGVTATTAEINKLAGLTATTTQLNYVTGVTSSIQTQLGAKSDTSHTHAYQAASNELTALSGLSGTGLVKRTGTNTFTLDTNTYAVTTSPTLNTSIVSGTTSFNLVNAVATTVNFAGAATALSVGSNDATAVTVLNAPTVRGNLTYVDLYNTLATTVNFAGASTTLNIGGTPTGAVIHTYSGNATLSGVTKTVNLGTGGAFGSITNVNIGSFTSGATGALNVNIPTTFNSTTVVQYPTDGSHVANKQYVDNIASGITIKTQTVYTTSANLVSVYTNGTSDSTGGTGVGAKLTASFNGALILDGVGVLTNQRVLVKDQTNALENGIYVVTNPGAGDAKWILTRSTDFNGNLTAGTIKPGNYIFVSSGTYLSNSSWLVSNSGTSTVTSGAIKVGTDPINLAQYSGTPLNISTLGNVSIGTWQATPIAEPYISTSIARLANPTFTGHVHVPLTPTDNQDATSKKYVDDLVFASLPYLPDIIPLDDLRYIFNGIDSRFEPRFQGTKVALYNPLRLMINLNGVVQTPSYPDYVWQSMLPLDGFMLDNDGYIAFTQVPPVGSTFDGRVMLGPNVNTIGKAYPFKAMDILLGG